MRERMMAHYANVDFSAVCSKCGYTLGEHKGSDHYCLKGPRYWETIADTVFAA